MPRGVLSENFIRGRFASGGRIIASFRLMLAILHLLVMFVATYSSRDAGLKLRRTASHLDMVFGSDSHFLCLIF
jgi:hypothetical protein